MAHFLFWHIKVFENFKAESLKFEVETLQSLKWKLSIASCPTYYENMRMVLWEANYPMIYLPNGDHPAFLI